VSTSTQPEPTPDSFRGLRTDGLPGPEDLDAVIGGQGLHAEFQPIIDLARASVVGYEALARFDGPVRSPLPWFESAAKHDRMAELEAAALRTSLDAHAILPVNTFLTVNIGPGSLDSPAVREVWADHPSLGGVIVELTEHERIDSYAALEPTLDQLRSAGALVAIDDAGAGYAGLQHVLTIRPDVIKLDRTLVAGLDRDEAKRALVEMIGTLAGRLDAWLLAEGIETGEELDVLLALGVPLAQGYFLGRPGPAFPALDVEAATRIMSQLRQAEKGGVRHLLEHVPTAADFDGGVAALADERVDVVVLLDEDGRPQGTLDVDGIVHALRDAGLRLNVDTPVAEAVQRALVRAAAHRFSPLVCIDDAGRYVGIVRMERLVDLLARPTG
jgi:EAL domain-containing protein (putative c-di-GMP-specific phosphodiesterase class I)